MKDGLTIGEVGRLTGLPAKTIRFYEERRVIPAPARSEGGYRLYSAIDVRRLRLLRQAKLLALSLPEITALLDQAFASECRDFAEQFLARIAQQHCKIDQRIAQLEELKREFEALTRHVQHSQSQLAPHQTVAGCDFCPILDVDPSASDAPAAGAAAPGGA